MYENKKIKNIEIDTIRMMNKPEYIFKGNEYYFSYEKVRELLAMACENIVPNGHYGDVECCLWSEMKIILCKENLKEWDV